MSYTGGKPDDVTFIVARVRAPRPPKEDRKQRDSGKRCVLVSNVCSVDRTEQASGSIGFRLS